MHRLQHPSAWRGAASGSALFQAARNRWASALAAENFPLPIYIARSEAVRRWRHERTSTPRHSAAPRLQRPPAQRDGIAVAPVPFDGKVVNFLIAMGWLDEALADDRAEVGKAIGAMVADAARERS